VKTFLFIGNDFTSVNRIDTDKKEVCLSPGELDCFLK